MHIQMLVENKAKQGVHYNLTEDLKKLISTAKTEDQAEATVFENNDHNYSRDPIKLTYANQNFGTNKGYAVDNQYLYVLTSSNGLVKMQYTNTMCPGQIIQKKSDVTGTCLMLLKDNLYVRNDQVEEGWPFKIYNKNTFEEVTLE